MSLTTGVFFFLYVFLTELVSYNGLEPLIWLSDESYLGKEANSYYIFHTYTKISHPLQNLSENCVYEDSKLSPSGSLMIIPCNIRKIFRHTYIADYFMFNLTTNSISTDTLTNLLYADWLSDKEIIGIQENNIILLKLVFMPNSRIYMSSQFLTEDGNSHIFNGVPDWVYEEEIFSARHGIEINLEMKTIMYTKINDRGVYKPQNIPMNNYNKRRLFYPLPGRIIPKISLVFQDLTTYKKCNLLAPHKILTVILYFAYVSGNEVIVHWTNRAQSVLYRYLYKVNVKEAESCIPQLIYKSTKTNSWVSDKEAQISLSHYDATFVYFLALSEINRKVPPTSDTKVEDGYLRIYTQKLTEIDSIYLLNTNESQWEVERIVCVGQNHIAYLSNKDDKFGKYLYIKFGIRPENFSTSSEHCINKQIHQYCTNVHVSASPGCGSFIVKCFVDSFWYNAIVSVNQDKIYFDAITTGNPKDTSILKDINRKCFSITGSLKNEIRICEHSHRNILKSHAFILLNIYGAPDFVNTINQPLDEFNTKLITDYPNIIILQIDGRGSFGIGKKNRYSVYGHLGEYESDDIRDVIKHYMHTYNIKNRRFCLLGWSYGGFLVLTTVARHSKYVTCVAAGAPVTDWRYYDSFYTERYMGELNVSTKRKYEETSLIINPGGLLGSNILIAYGTNDENVHPRNSYELIDQLKKLGTHVVVHVGQGQRHFFQDEDKRIRLWESLRKFIISNLR